MANSIALAQKYLPILDGVYKAAAKTAILETATEEIRFDGVDTVKLFKTSMDGMGNYNRDTGFVNGGVTGTWETMQLSQDRGRSFMVDAMDNEESMSMAFGTLASEFIRTKVVPEMDAYRFAKLCGTSGVTVANADLDGSSDVANLIATAQETMGDDEVPNEGRILFLSEKAYHQLKKNITRYVDNSVVGVNKVIETFDGMPIVVVPKGRFNTAITQYDGVSSGETAGGYIVPASTSYAINFMIVHPSAVKQITKLVVPRIFSPEVNQRAYGWQYDFRIVHDIFVEANKVKGVYVHRASTANA